MKRSILLLPVLAGLLLAPPVRAINVETQNRAALQVGPAISELNVERGISIDTTIEITNLTDKSLIVNTYPEKLELAPGTTSSSEEVFNAKSWVRVTVPQFAIQAGETRKVTVTVLPPDHAEPGSHYATVYFESLLPRESLAPNTALQNARVGSLLFMNVKGERTVDLGLTVPLQTSHFRQVGPVDFNFVIANTGNSHTLPSGSITVSDWRGNQVAELDLPTSLILPKTTKNYLLSWDRRWLFGHYTARLVATYGPDHNPLTSQIDFWVAPVWLVLGLISALAVLAWLILATRGRWGRALRVFFARSRY